MILFKKDWLKYPNAIIHYKTKNKSFLRLAEIYYQMGIDNCAFHLALLNPQLEEVDPHSVDLDLKTKALILEECKNNPWYFFREIVRVSIKGSLEAKPFRADRGNIALYWLFFNHILTFYLVQRQTGKTVSLSTLALYLLDIGATNTYINLLTKDDSLRDETLKKIKDMFEDLPSYINLSKKGDIFNSEEIYLKELKNTFKGNLSNMSPKLAEKVARGFSSPINLVDEAVYIPNIEIALSAMLMAGNAAREFARREGKPYGTIIVTTKGDIDDRDAQFVYRTSNCAAIFNEKFFDCENEEELNEVILKNTNFQEGEFKRPMVCIDFTFRQLGYDDEWLKTRLSEIISTPENIARDIYNMWTSGNMRSPIPKEYINTMKEHINESPRGEFFAPFNYLLRWYISEEEIDRRIYANHHFIIGVDTSDAAGRDDTAFVVRDHVTSEVIAVTTFNEMNLITIADFFVAFLLKYPNSTMIIERRSSAPAIIDYLIKKLCLHDINPFTRLYNTIVQNKDENLQLYQEIIKARTYDESLFEKHKKTIGFTTSASGVTSRSSLYSTTLLTMMKYSAYVIYDKRLSDQIASLIVKNNRIDHPDGGKDDLVIASLLSFWLMTQGRNLSTYGIDPSQLFRLNKVYLEEKYNTKDEEVNEEEIMQLEKYLQELTNRLKEERNEIVSQQLELQIRKIAEELIYHNHSISVEEMLENIRREKRFRRKVF